MKARKRPHVTVTALSEHTATVRGANVRIAIAVAGCPALFDHRPLDGGDACWTVPLKFAGAVMDAAFKVGGTACIGQETLL